MRVIARSMCVAFIAFLGVVGLAVAWTTTTAVQLLATTALIMGGTDHPLIGPKDSPSFVTDYLDKAVTLYINPSATAGNGTAGSVDKVVPVYTPEEFFPVYGSLPFNQSVEIGRQNLHTCLAGSVDCIYNQDPLVDPDVPVAYPPAVDDDLVVFGYSQSAVVASLVKQDLIDNYVAGDQKSFLFVANPMRGNGGILMRGIMLPSIPFFGITFYGATPTDSEVLDDNGTPDDPTDDTYAYPSADYVQQYDGLGGDFPFRPLNLFATINALAGYALLHGGVVNKPSSEALFQGKHGDTSFYMFPTELVPILMPLAMIGVPKPILSFFDEFARVLIEDAYLRDVNPGVPTAASLLPFGNPITLVLKLLAAIPVAIDNALEDLGVGRALGTTASGPFGVGGPPLPAPPESLTTTVSTLAETTEVVGDDVDNTVESGEPQALSFGSEETEEPTTEPEPTVEPTETATVEPEPPVVEETETTTPEPNETPSATDPDRPEVRGPIEFDSPEPQPNSPSTDPDDTVGGGTTPDPEPPAESENDDADAAA